MSQVIPFNQAPLPAHLQAAAANVNQQAAVGTGGGMSVDHISLKGGRFHLVKGGQTTTLQQFTLNVVIIHANPGVTKAWYASAWNPDQEANAPECASDDGIVPRADSPMPQCNNCAACPQNQFGSKINPQTGAKSKACADKKTIAIVTPDNVGGDMVRLQIPAASMAEFGAYLRNLPAAYYAVITEISFDTTVSFPKIKFRPIDYVRDPAAFQLIEQRHHSDEAKAIAGVAGFVQMRAAAPAALGAPVQQPMLAPPAHIQQQIPVQQVSVEQPVYQQPVQQGFGAPVQQPMQQPVYQQPVYQQPVQQPVYEQPIQQPAPVQQPVYQQPVAQPMAAPAPQDPALAAIFGGQQVQQPVAQPAPVMQQATPPAANVHPSGREYGRPMPGKARRTKAEMAEDAAVGIGKAPGEQDEEEAATEAAPQLVQQAQQEPQFGAQQPVQQTYQQPANQPQVMTGGAVDAFSGWDD